MTSDCNDSDPGVHPGAVEVGDGVDNDCDGVTDEGTPLFDDDGDGVSESEGDCDDTDPTIVPASEEIPYDGVDQDCNGFDLIDLDGDGFPGGEGPDCNDGDEAIHPGAEDSLGDGVDQDCNGSDSGPPPDPGENCLYDDGVVGNPGEVNYPINSADTDSSPAPEGSYYDDIEFEAEAGQELTVELRSSEFNPLFLLLDPACEVMATSTEIQEGYDDDERHTFTVGATGIYTVVVTTEVAGVTGDYTLRVREGEPEEGGACALGMRTLSYGETGSGNLNGGDWEDGPLGEGARYEDWEFAGEAGDEVRVTAVSEGLALRVWLLDAECAPLAEEGGGGEGEEVILTHTLSETGPHTVYIGTDGELTDPSSFTFDLELL